MQPAPEADARTLARRLTLALTGLPPTPEIVDAFSADKSPHAYEKYVDPLMASPHYGEHRGRYWLDASRYADTHGIHFDNFREMWSYRDNVIAAFNRNTPFDQFTIEQLAGDLLPNATPEQKIATGFQRCAETTNEGGTIPEENICNLARDRVETTSWVWLAATANCCVCHDHKFDPFLQKEFYSMSAFFRNTTQGALDGNVRDSAPVMQLPREEDRGRLEAIPREIAAVKTALGERKKSLRAEFDAWLGSAKAGEWQARVDARGRPRVLLPLNETAATDTVSGRSADKVIEAKATQPVKWADGGKLGHMAPELGGKMIFEAAGELADFEKDQAYSCGCWVKLPALTTGGALIGHMDDTAGFPGWDLFAQGGQVAAHLIHIWPTDAVKVETKGTVLKPKVWQHVCVTYDGSGKAEGFKIFVDGKDEPLKVDQNGLRGSTKVNTPIAIGRRKSQAIVPAGTEIQDVRIYDRKLAPGEVHELAILPQMEQTLSKPSKERTAKEATELYDAYGSSNADVAVLVEKEAKLAAEQKAIHDRGNVAFIMEEKKGAAPVARVLLRGAYDKPGDTVEPGVFSALHPMPKDAPKNRLGLAQWLMSKENPLTCRVIVNRYWQELFGTGIVRTAEDFGTVGENPSHPELLDYLAVQFRDGGWDTKQIIKQLVMSATYRQSAQTSAEKIERDPANRLLSRGARFRMDAEQVRDYALAVSGLLSPKMDGPSVKPYQPDGLWDVVGMPAGNTRTYKRDSGESLYRRSIYTFWKRMAPPASLEIFNAPSRETACLRRERTDTPMQALVTLNDTQFVEAARVLAQNVIAGGSDDAARIDALARRVLLRPLREQEKTILTASLQKLLAHYKAHPDAAKGLLSIGESKADAKIEPATLAAWTMLSNELLNLDEVLNK